MQISGLPVDWKGETVKYLPLPPATCPRPVLPRTIQLIEHKQGFNFESELGSGICCGPWSGFHRMLSPHTLGPHHQCCTVGTMWHNVHPAQTFSPPGQVTAGEGVVAVAGSAISCQIWRHSPQYTPGRNGRNSPSINVAPLCR